MAGEKIRSLEDAVSIIRNGDTIAIGGFIFQNKPMALIREIVRQKKKDLFVICAAPSSIDIDMLIGGGCVKRLARQSLTAERMGPTLPSFRRAGQAGEIEIIEFDQGMMVDGLNAAKKGLPSMPSICALGADFINRNPDYFKMYSDPITGEPVVAVRALKPNVTLVHSQVCDDQGHAQDEGQSVNDVLACMAADKVIVSTDQIVPTEVIRRNAWKTITLPNSVAAVVEVPYGAHPCASQGHYPYDGDSIREYLAAARSPEGLKKYFSEYVYGVKSHGEYLTLIGMDRLIKLRETNRLLARSDSEKDVEMAKGKYSISELMACLFAREMKDGDVAGFPGVRSEVPLASVGLASRMHAPNMIAYTTCGVVSRSQLYLSGTTTDYERYVGAEFFIGLDDLFDLLHKGMFAWWFAGGMQIDTYGNINLVLVGDDWKRPKLLGPGTAGINSENFAGRIFVWMNEHTQRMFVKKVDFISCAGHGPHDRKKLGLKGGGPSLVVSPLGVMDFEPKSGRMRLKSVHPGITVQKVKENTGFELVMPERVPETQAPTEEELRILRTEVDPYGILRTAEPTG